MNINKKLSQNGEHETNAGIDLFKSSNTGNLEYKDHYGKTITIADHTYVEKSMQEVVNNIQDGFNLEFKKDSVGPKVSFTKVNGADIDQPENRDIIIPGLLEITRGNSGGGIFNYPFDEGYSNSAPAYTYWNTQFLDNSNTSWAPLTNITNRTFDYWRNAIQMPGGGQAPPQYVGIKTVMQFQNPESGETRYWLIEFTYWGIGDENDYGFAYDRYEIFPSIFFEQPDAVNTDSPAIIEPISEGVHLAKAWYNRSLYNVLLEENDNNRVSPKKTRWNSMFIDTRPGYSDFTDLTNIKNRVYTDFYSALNGDVADNITGLALVMHDLTTDLYWAIQFGYWNGVDAAPGQISDWNTTNAGSGYVDGDSMLTATGGTGESCFIYVTVTDGVPAITYFNGGNDYTIGDILTFSDGSTEDPLIVEVVKIYQVGGYSYYRQVIPQGDAIKFADGTELDSGLFNSCPEGSTINTEVYGTFPWILAPTMSKICTKVIDINDNPGFQGYKVSASYLVQEDNFVVAYVGTIVVESVESTTMFNEELSWKITGNLISRADDILPDSAVNSGFANGATIWDNDNERTIPIDLVNILIPKAEEGDGVLYYDLFLMAASGATRLLDGEPILFSTVINFELEVLITEGDTVNFVQFI
jgi:hypothetical protein